MPPDLQLRELNERLSQLARVIYTLQGYALESRKPPVTYGLLADNLYQVWKRHAKSFGSSGPLANDVAQELGYTALAVYSVGKRAEKEAYVRCAKLVGEMLSDWYVSPQSSD